MLIARGSVRPGSDLFLLVGYIRVLVFQMLRKSITPSQTTYTLRFQLNDTCVSGLQGEKRQDSREESPGAFI